MGNLRGWINHLLVCCICGTIAAGPSNIGITAQYIRSVAKLCGWAECQGFCQQYDEILPVDQYHNSEDRGCSTSRYNEQFQAAFECDDAVCVTQKTFRRGCNPSVVEKTACFSLYYNASTTKVHPRVCWDGPSCMDLVSFCRQQSSLSCLSFGATTTSPTTTTKSPETTHETNPKKTTSENSSVQPGTIFSSGSPSAEPVKGQPVPFVVGIVTGACVATMPIIIGAVILLIMKKRFNSRSQVKDSKQRSESLEMADGPVYASIGPEVPPKPPGSQTIGPSFLQLPPSGITSSARSLHISGPRRPTLLGNLQRNKSLPALAYAVNSIPMETNEILRAVTHSDQRSRSSSSPQSPDIAVDQVNSPHRDGGYNSPLKSPPMTSPSWDMSRHSPDVTNSRVISARDSGRGLTNKLYSEAVLPGPPSTYSTDDTIPHQYVNLQESYDQLLPDHKNPNTTDGKYASTQRGPSVNQEEGNIPTGGEYMGLESAGALGGPSAGQYMGLVECGPDDRGTAKLGVENKSVPSPNGEYIGSEQWGGSHYMGLDAGTMSGSNTNGYMGLTCSNQHKGSEHINCHTTSVPTDSAYMGLERSNAQNTNQYMGIGDSSSECEQGSLGKALQDPPLVSGTGAYSELNLRSRETQQESAYMGLTTAETSDTAPRKDSQISASSYVDLDPHSELSESITVKQTLNKAGKDERAARARRKYWKSKSTFQKRKPSEDGFNTTYEGLQPQQKPKKSFLFKSKKKSRPSGKANSKQTESDLCLDLRISSPPPEETAKPHYFTLDVNSSTYDRCNGEASKQGFIDQVGSVRESKQPHTNKGDKDAFFNLEEPFRRRSKSQPVQQNSSHYDEYEMIGDN